MTSKNTSWFLLCEGFPWDETFLIPSVISIYILCCLLFIFVALALEDYFDKGRLPNTYSAQRAHFERITESSQA